MFKGFGDEEEEEEFEVAVVVTLLFDWIELLLAVGGVGEGEDLLMYKLRNHICFSHTCII